jgi:preprotein translocase subunit SecD
MIRNSPWKVALVVAAALFGILFTAPNFMSPDMRAKLPPWLPNQTISLGLDLQGGSRLVYQVDTDALKTERLNNQVDDARRALRDANVGAADVSVSGNSVVVRVQDASKLDAAYAALEKIRGSVRTSTGGAIPEFLLDRVPAGLQMTLQDQAVTAQITSGVEQAKTVIERRINSLGTRETRVERQGADRIVVSAPGLSDPKRLMDVVGKTAKLTFQMVDGDVTPDQIKAGRIPLLDEKIDPYKPGGEAVVVKKRVIISGEMLTHAQLEFEPQTNQPVVGFRLNDAGGRAFLRTTTDYIGQRFAIVLDGKLVSAPRINGVIPGGQGIIEGGFTPESASELALLLNSGALPVQLKVVDQSAVGAELGAESIRAGAISLAVGAAAIFAFIILAYGLFGVFAAIALIINVLLMLGIMSSPILPVTLTLPGIAGVILTLAVAVDANVLVYERMRDEARAGHAPMMSADMGFRRALVSIADANITTLIAAFIMFQAGNILVKGFAVTLSIGVVTSVFTAILVTQVLIGWWFKVAKPKQLPI